mgnify:CR=1 FL=1
MKKKTTKTQAPKVKDTEIVVYFKGEKPETIYKVYNKPEIGENPYVVIEGFWLPEQDGNGNKYHFVENQCKTFNKWDKDWLMNHIIPDKTAVKCYDSLEEFQNEMFLNNI